MLNVLNILSRSLSSVFDIIVCTKCSYSTVFMKLNAQQMASKDRLFNNQKGCTPQTRFIRNLQKIDKAVKSGIAPTNLAPHSIETTIISPGSIGTPRSVSINLLNFRYLFNCGEGTQRLCSEQRQLPKTQDIFITRSSWENLGGLLGVCLTLQAGNMPGIRLHGPPNIEKIITESKGFSEYSRLTIQIVKNELHSGYYEDDATRVEYITMTTPRSPSLKSNAKRQKVSHNDECVAYLCKPKPRARNIDIEKCFKLGIPSGKIIGQLKNGETVTLQNGTVVTPEEVLFPPTEDQPYLVLECPTIDHLDSIEEDERIHAIYTTDNTNDVPCLIYHFTEDHVLLHPKYIQWIQKFPATTQHIVCNQSCTGLGFRLLYEQQALLNMIEPRIFPQLPLKTQTKELPLSNMVYGVTGLKYTVRGRDAHMLNRDHCLTYNIEELQQTALNETENLATELEKFKKSQKLKESEGETSYPELVFLGTGSAVPSSRRNASGILLNISADKTMLLDCGEDTLGQLIRYYGDQASDVVARLKAVFISHLHADHHMGIFGLAKYRKSVFESRGMPFIPLPIIGPSHLEKWYSCAASIVPDLSNIIRILFVQRFHKDQEMLSNPLLDRLDMDCLQTVFVKHSGFPHAVILTHKTGWKIIYSGDTMPHQGFIQEGLDCDLLIHEATLEDGCEEDALYKKHSTTSQAIKVGQDMRAKFTLLTHFSQRYSKLPKMNDAYSDHVGFAFDNMRVSLDELKVLPQMQNVLTTLYADEMAKYELNKMNRAHRDGPPKTKAQRKRERRQAAEAEATIS